MTEEQARKARADPRRDEISAKKTHLGAPDEPPPSPTGDEGISLAWRLSLASWVLSGRELPTYARETMPIRYLPNRR